MINNPGTLLLLLSLLLAACQNNLEAGAREDNSCSLQVIVKPNPGVTLSGSQSSEFFRHYQVDIVYLREMSGGAHVVRIHSASTDACQSTLKRLNRDPRIEYAEPDLKMEPQAN